VHHLPAMFPLQPLKVLYDSLQIVIEGRGMGVTSPSDFLDDFINSVRHVSVLPVCK